MIEKDRKTGENLRARLATLEDTYRAILNILEDLTEERNKADDARRALTNMLEDVETERARAENANTLLEATNRELESFSYSVSHDLRAPLRAISGFSEAVMEDYASRLDDQGRRYLGFIAENANKMGQLIDDLLAFSRLGRQPVMKAAVDIGALAEAISGELLSQSPGRKIRFTIRPAPPAYGDRAMIHQVLVNLFSNAVKFTKNKDVAEIEFGYQENPDDDTGGAYYIRDNGAGFDMRYVDKLFGVFQRLHSIAEFDGTGVGLALVSRIITRHGGRVRAHGEVDRGAVFYFTLPEEKPNEQS